MDNSNSVTGDAQGTTVIVTEVRPAWLTYKEAEVYASLSRTTLWRLVGSEQIRAARIGKAVRIERKSLEDFLRHSTE